MIKMHIKINPRRLQIKKMRTKSLHNSRETDVNNASSLCYIIQHKIENLTNLLHKLL